MKVLLLSCAFLSALVLNTSAQVSLKNGETVAFLGDSITQQGWDKPGGYVRLLVKGLESAGVKIEPLPAGVGGNKSPDMLARLQRDVLAKNPDWLLLSCGVNDVWHGERNQGVSLEDYARNITEIVDRAQAAGIKVLLLTATMISEDPAANNNQKLAPYNEFLRALAKEKKCLLADVSADMIAGVNEAKKANPSGSRFFTTDGVHMGYSGNAMMARTILRAFGVTDANIKAAESEWDKIPGTHALTLGLSKSEYDALVKAAADQKTSPEKFLRSTFLK